MTDFTSGLEAALDALDARLTAVEARPDPTDVGTELAALRTDVDDIETRVTALEEHVGVLDQGVDALEDRVTVLENPSPGPVAAFTLDFTTGTAPLTVTAHQTCTNADHFQFDWKGGTTVGIVHPPTDNDIEHVYDKAGAYHIDLRAWRDSDGKDAHAYVDVTVAAPTPPPTGGKLGLSYGGYSLPLEQAKASGSTLDTLMLKLKDLGVGWLRADYPVRDVSPSQGAWNWAAADGWVTRAIAAGIQPLLIVYMLPQWMNGHTDDKYQPTDNQMYADWCYTASRHWQEIGVRWVELWNEPNWTFWKPRPDRYIYTDLVVRSADAIKSNSNVKVVAGALSTADVQYQAVPSERSVTINGVTYTSPEVGAYCTMDLHGKLGMFSHIDAYSFHPYYPDYDPGVDAMPWPRWAPGSIGRAIQILDRYAPGRNLQVWMSECGVSRSEVTATVQANRDSLAFAAYNSFVKQYRAPQVPVDRVGPFFRFCVANRDTTDPREAGFGCLDKNYANPYPCYNSVKTACAATLT